jgi:dihydroorotase-like cyclic amidohydrolase
MLDLVLRSRRVVTPDGERPAAVAVAGGTIVGLSEYGADLDALRTVDVGELAVLPGLVDTHVHVNEPGRTEWEGFATATRAAAAGGVTTIVDMPLNSIPPTVDHVAVGGCIPTDDVIRGVVDIHAGSDHSVWRAIRSQTEEVAGDRAPGAVHFDSVVEASMNGQTPDRAAPGADQQRLRAGAAFAIQLDQDVCIIANG